MTPKGDDFFFEGHRSIRYIQDHISYIINMMLTDSFHQQKVDYHKPFVTLGRHVQAEIIFLNIYQQKTKSNAKGAPKS